MLKGNVGDSWFGQEKWKATNAAHIPGHWDHMKRSAGGFSSQSLMLITFSFPMGSHNHKCNCSEMVMQSMRC